MKELKYTHRVRYTFTEYNEPERRGIKFHQNFTREDWAEEFRQWARSSKYLKDVSEVEEIKEQ